MDGGNDPWSWVRAELEAIERAGLRRVRRRRESPPVAGRVMLDGRAVVNFGSNDYLALAADERLVDAVRRFAGYHGWGSAASPLVAGHGALHERLEQRLAAFEGTEAALLFPSGFAANSGVIAALTGPGDRIFSDRLNHASLIDGIRLARAECVVYPHRDLETLRAELAASASARRRLIVTDSIFSMDGDAADLVGIAELAERYDALVLIDEAHATGVFGPSGRGLHEALDMPTERLVIVGTLSKGLGASGGFVAGRRDVIELLLQRARTYMFSTAVPEASCAAALAALDIVDGEPHRRHELLARAETLRAELSRRGWREVGSSQIVPLRIGDSERALAASRDLAERGFFVPAIRPPAVPDGESLLRLSLTWGHDESMIAALLEALSPAP